MFGYEPPHREPTPPPNTERRYVCPRCERELHLDYVKSVSAPLQTAPNSILIRVIHACPCQEWVRSTRYPYDEGALTRLFGHRPTLPWPRPYGDSEGMVLEANPQQEQTPRMRLEERWRWDLEAITTSRDFLLFCRGPRDDLYSSPE